MKRTFMFAAALPLMLIACASSGPSDSEKEDGNVATTAQDISTCGVAPPVSACTTRVCTNGFWDVEPAHNGAACKTGLRPGTCSGGECVSEYPVTGDLYPNYQVITIAYAPPGNGSQVSYGAQSTIGSEVDLQDIYKVGAQVSVSGGVFGGVGLQFGYASGSVTGSSAEVSKTVGSSIGLVSTSDPLNHQGDTFFILTNPVIHVSQSYPGAPIVNALGSNGSANIVPVTVANLLNPSAQPAWMKTALAKLTASDYASILSLDPLAKASVNPILGPPQPDPKRFIKYTTLQVDGPSQVGGPIPVFGTSFTNEATNGTQTGVTTAVTAGVSLSAGIPDVLTTQLTLTFEWDYQATTQSKVGNSESATATLQSPTVGYHGVYDVYFDTLFNSFAFSPPPINNVNNLNSVTRVNLVGQVTDVNGAPVAGQPVKIQFADQTTRIVGTHSDGTYEVLAAPEGSAIVETGGVTSHVVVAASSVARLNLAGATKR